MGELQPGKLFRQAAREVSPKVYLYSSLGATGLVLLIGAMRYFFGTREYVDGRRRLVLDKEFMACFQNFGEFIIEYHQWIILVLLVLIIILNIVTQFPTFMLFGLQNQLRWMFPNLGEGELEEECKVYYQKYKKLRRQLCLWRTLGICLSCVLLVQGLYELHINYGLPYLWVSVLFVELCIVGLAVLFVIEAGISERISNNYLAEREDTATAEEKKYYK